MSERIRAWAVRYEAMRLDGSYAFTFRLFYRDHCALWFIQNDLASYCSRNISDPIPLVEKSELDEALARIAELEKQQEASEE